MQSGASVAERQGPIGSFRLAFARSDFRSRVLAEAGSHGGRFAPPRVQSAHAAVHQSFIENSVLVQSLLESESVKLAGMLCDPSEESQAT